MYIRKYRDKWRAEVERNGIRASKVCNTKREAQAWGNVQEAAAKIARRGGDHTFADAVAKYKECISAKKDGGEWEFRRLDVMLRYFGEVPLSEIDAPQIAQWRDDRLQTVSGSTVVREANLLRNLFNVARLEWKWCEHKPFDGVRLPKENQPRHSIWTWQLIKRVLRAERSGKTREVQDAFHIALRTAMRLAEVLQAPQHFDGRVVTIKTKTEVLARIPIGRIGARLLKRPAFTVGPNEASVLFSKLCRELLIEGLTFHDARATALTHLSRKVDVMTLAKISRHKDLSLLLNVYYRETSEQIASRI